MLSSPATSAWRCFKPLALARCVWLAASLVSVLVGFSSCASSPSVRLAEGPREYVPSDYEQVLSRWTRTQHLLTLSELDDILTVTATFESWDFRWAYVVRYAQDYRLRIEQRRALLQSTVLDSRQHHQFYVALYGGQRRWTEMTKPSSAWVVRLFDDAGNETAPEEIVAIRKPGAIERTYFPYTTPWRQVYRIRFPAHTASGPTIARSAKLVGLRFAGAQGSEELVWQLDGGNATRGPTE